MIALIDYGLGNLRAFSNVYKRLGISVVIAKYAKDLVSTSKLILPGVGAFDHAMQLFKATDMQEEITRLVLQEGIPILGICVGMQMLSCSSEEGLLPGLGWIDGVVKKINVLSTESRLRLPHMGWNDVRSLNNNTLFNQLEDDAKFYFLHSYYFHCNNAANILAEADYGKTFACAVNHKNIYGVQFHPEKSHHYGAQLLKNFADL